MKPYDLGMLVGRFQHFHIGHRSLVETGLKLCDRMLILVGSAQESGTLRNPYDVATRIDVIKAIYGDAVEVRPLCDMTHEGDITPEWGRYLMRHEKQCMLKLPNVMIYGNDESRSGWFDKADIKWVEVIVPREWIDTSATRIRGMIVRNQIDEWMKWTDPKTHKLWPRLQSELLAVDVYRQQLEDIMKFGTPLKGWEDGMKVNV